MKLWHGDGEHQDADKDEQHAEEQHADREEEDAEEPPSRDLKLLPTTLGLKLPVDEALSYQ